MPASFSPLNYTGSKSCIADLILSVTPPHQVYIEPCMGSAELFFRKKQVKKEILNDYDGNLVNFFRVLQDSDKLRYLLGRVALSINAEELFHGNRELLDSIPNVLDDLKETERIVNSASKEDIDQAAAFLETQFYSFSSTGQAYGIAVRNIVTRIPRLIAATHRLRQAAILHRDYKDAITYGACKGAFIFLDPPYLDTEAMYHNGNFDREEHKKLFALMDEINRKYQGECKFLITYKAEEEIIGMARECGFDMWIEKRLHAMRQRAEAGSEFPELLVSNYLLEEQALENGYIINPKRQLCLFDIYEKQEEMNNEENHPHDG